MKITKGVIAAAGRGTRFLPLSKAVPKEMLPVVDKPVIQYIAEEFALAGITDIMIVLGRADSPIRDYFEHSPDLEGYLRGAGKEDLAAQMRQIPEIANFSFAEQVGDYGNGTACLAARDFTGDEPFVYAFGDDLVLSPESFTKSMTDAHERDPGIYMGVQEVAREEVVKYGIVAPKAGAPGEVASLVEKPTVAEAPSNLAVFGRYILPPEIFAALARVGIGKGGELWIVDAVQDLIRSGTPAYYKSVAGGKWYTTGDPVSYLRAVRAFALARADLHEKLKDVFIP